MNTGSPVFVGNSVLYNNVHGTIALSLSDAPTRRHAHD